MSFSSSTFPFFFLIVWILYRCLKHRPQNVLLLIASYVFYGCWNWRFLALLFISTIANYYIAIAIERCGDKRPKTKWALLMSGVGMGFCLLGFFKYFNFFAESFTNVCAPFGLHPGFVTLNILLPVGISFFTFQTVAYITDVYREKIKATRNFLDFSLFVAYFPHITSGPIARAEQLMPQIANPRSINRAMVYSAVQLILVGYFKKVFIADGVTPLVDDCFSKPDQFGGVTLFLGTVLFMFQAYGDFSGYTDIARGVSRLFGIDLMINFRQPYLASNPSDFWQRWHISLSSWFGDYVYNPLYRILMKRKGYINRTMSRKNYVFLWMYVSLMVTMMLCGLWHGASMTFVAWGLLQGVLLCIHGSMRANRIFHVNNPSKMWNTCFWTAGVVTTFFLLSLVRVFFRAETCSDACTYFYYIAQGGTTGLETVGFYVCFYGFWLFLIDILCYWQDSEVPFTDRIWMPVRSIGYACMLFLVFYIGESDVKPFIYMGF